MRSDAKNNHPYQEWASRGLNQKTYPGHGMEGRGGISEMCVNQKTLEVGVVPTELDRDRTKFVQRIPHRDARKMSEEN